MIIKCSWCNKILSEGNNRKVKQVSHGLCSKCEKVKRVEMERIEKARAKGIVWYLS